MKVLVACEFSGIVREAFKTKGHDAWSCDLLPTEIPGQHIQGDVLEILNDGWDLMIAHPPCTYLANSGVRWLYKDYPPHCYVPNEERWNKMTDAARLFAKLLLSDIPKICIENPIMHIHALKVIDNRLWNNYNKHVYDKDEDIYYPRKTRYDQIIQPWQFGHGETKATCLWLKNLPLLKPTNIVDGRIARVHKEPPSPDRWKNRSRTYIGIAKAMAEQWG